MKNELLTRAYLVAGALTLFALLVLAQTFRIGVQEADYWKQREQETHVQMRTQKAPRGNILAADGSYLATSQFQYDLHFDPNSGGLTQTAFDEGIDSLAYFISTKINPAKTPDSIATELRASREKGGHYYPLVKKASHERFREMQTWPVLRRGRNRGGFGSHSKDTRQHHYGMMAQRTIGYVKDVTSVGLEGYFDNVLAGEEVVVAHQLKASGSWEPLIDISDLNLERGMDVQTTLEVTIQDHVQQVIRRAVQKSQAEYGVAVVMECKTGAIRALTSLSRYKNGSISESYNHAVGTRVEPGSTFKLASMLALLDDKKIKLDDTIRIFNGRKEFGDQLMKDASYHNGLDTTTARYAFEISSNVGIASMVSDNYGNDLAGRKAFVNKLRQFRLENATEVEIKGEAYPLIKNPEKDTINQWSGITLPWMSMGYELELTPLQMTAFYNAVANDGKYVKPRLIDNTQRDGKVIEQFEPLILNNQIASKSAIKAAKELLEGVVLRGTAKKEQSDLYRFAGKTGTVQYDYSPEAKRRGVSGHQASFIGYFPAEDPHYTIMVLISKPKVGSYYGSEAALPVWKDIADNLYASDPNLRPALHAAEKPTWIAETLPRKARGDHNDISQVFASLGIPAFDQAQRGIVELRSPGDTLTVVPYNIPAGRIPDVRGMGIRDAMYLLESRGCRVDVRGRGQVKRQSIRPGTKANGQFVKLTLG
ncbi:MAG: penicillin-binding protein [Saprospiraceae bacterium]